MSDPVLSLQAASLSLDGNAGPVSILDAISLDVHGQETGGLVGPSVSGKSSLLMLMGGLEQATSGKVMALGHDLTTMSEAALARLRRDHFGVVFQIFHLLPAMTEIENVAAPLELAGVADAYDRAEAELRAVGLSERVDHYPSQMSGGEQQRVALARAAAPRPDILLADEPTGNLDSVNGAAIIDLLFGLRERHSATLVMVTHAPDLAARCDRVLTLTDGRIATTEAAACACASRRGLPRGSCGAGSRAFACFSVASSWVSLPSLRWARSVIAFQKACPKKARAFWVGTQRLI